MTTFQPPIQKTFSPKALIQKYSLWAYFVLTFVLSWGGILWAIGGPSGIPGTPDETTRLLPLTIMVMLIGPSVAGLLLTALVDGRAGLRTFLARLLKWRVGVRWYGVALLTVPLVAMGTLFALAITSPVFLPGIYLADDKISMLLTGLAVGLSAGVFEELGWTGFAVPKLRQRYGLVTTGLLVGILWGAWHYLVALWGSGGPDGAFSLMLFLPPFTFYIAVLPIYRILMVWVNDQTESLWLAMLMHGSLTGGILFIFMPPTIAGVALITWYLTLAGLLGIIVLAVLARNTQATPKMPHRDARPPLHGHTSTKLRPSG